MKKWNPEQMQCSDKWSSYGKLRGKPFKREAPQDSIVANAESEANKVTSKRITAKLTWNWPATFAVDNGWQDFRSETLLVDATQVFEEKSHLVMSEIL